MEIVDTLFFDQQPELMTLWEAYLGLWQRWAAEDRRAKKVQDVYSRLFAMYQTLSAFEEANELVVGLGYLSWKTQGGEEVRRHLLTAQATLHFDALRGLLTLTAGAEGARTALEQDMLDRELHPQAQVQQAIAEALEDSGEEVWSAAILPPLLQTWVQALSASGTYSSELVPPRQAGEQPQVTLAPALVMRRRGERSLTSAYRDILRQVQDQPDAPANLAPFTVSSHAPASREDVLRTGRPSELYFPLPANDAQSEIITYLERQPGVLVQGPPGTGKSHTIVNLVSHLLATNQRVLVTSHTARALKVLREKFPPELAALCVTYLRGEEGAKGTLERSVQEVLQRANHRNSAQEQRQLDTLVSALERLRQEETDLLNTLRDIRSSEAQPLEFFGYRGTAQDIAGSLRAQEAEYGWLEELGQPNRDVPLSSDEALRLLALLRSTTPQETQELAHRLPNLSGLPEAEEFMRAVQEEQQALHLEQAGQAARAHPHYSVLEAAPGIQRDQLIAALQALMAAAQTARRQANPWAGDATGAVLRGQLSKWRGVLATSEQLLPPVQRLLADVGEPSVTGMDGHPAETVLSDAQTVLAHLKGGGNWGGFFGKAPAVKERQYLRETVRVNGQPAATPEVLQTLVDALKLDRQITVLEDTWAAVQVRVTGPRSLRLAQLAEEGEALERLLKLTDPLSAAQDAVRAVAGLPEPQWWDDAEVSALLSAARAAGTAQAAALQRRLLETLVPGLEGLLAAGNAHPVVQRLSNAIQQRHTDAYGLALLHARTLLARRDELSHRDLLMGRLRQGAPALGDELARTPADPVWDTRLAHLETAWRWMRAEAYLEELANPDAETEKRTRLTDCRQEIRNTLKELATQRAWQSTLDRLTFAEQQALVRWEQAIKRLGKGTGKHAERWRKVARDALEEARTAIPAWIMPLHTVAETFGMKPGMFDVVIVDEASQAGPESLFLTFIAKKIIIVGDDKQIEPEGIGIVTERLDALVKQYLYDFPAKEILGNPKASLFAFGQYSYPPTIALREHFRCMPEIIAFSSRLSYASQPLIALRQYGADRLAPLIAQHVPDGSNRGNNVNPQEARALVEQIKACIANPRYAGKTFGVISLVGDEQAEHIASLLRQELPEAELERRRLVCGNAYSFQGDERDVMFLSMVTSPSEGRTTSKVGTDSAIFQPRYNVAASRARDQMWLFHSVTPADLHPDDLRSMLIKQVQDPDLTGNLPLPSAQVLALQEQARRPGRRLGSQPSPFDSWFELDVYLEIVRRGYRVAPQVEMNGYRIDLVVEGLRGRLAVECDGDFWHGPDRYADDLRRQQVLERAGMVFWRVRGSTYQRDPEAALTGLWAALDARGVYPEGDLRNTLPVEEPAPAPWTSEVPAPTPAAQSSAASADHTEALEATVTEAVPQAEQPANFHLAAYVAWEPRPLPDPRSVTVLAPVIEGLREIVAVEGPLSAKQAYQLYARASGLPYSKALQSLLNRSVAQGVRSGVFLQENEWGLVGQMDKVLRVPGTPPVRLRQRGSRELASIPPYEVAALMRELLRLEPELDTPDDPEPLYRRVLGLYGAQRLTLKAREALTYAYGCLQKSKETVTASF
ncbi:AAA domain-containing protein [Deinococcus sp. KNUC1210]|uniref:AAA domain-containing protein n=1 Tax=Deinococcus sp. KNUC1210 TaxID=2917691 RepID=UPI001EF09126|nr:AAA domain-containing protein [Deinococcus sp. KNUC1210]ULH16662.1 AAA domain-containing protein [Deinococcus sp. KNUC1210]